MEPNELIYASVKAGRDRLGRDLGTIAAVFLGTILCGCRQVVPDKSPATRGEATAIHEAMRRKDEIVYLSTPELDPQKSVLLLLHGATDDPSEMMGIVEAFREKYNVLLYAYNYHQPLKKVALDLDDELKLLRVRMKKLNVENLNVESWLQ